MTYLDGKQIKTWLLINKKYKIIGIKALILLWFNFLCNDNKKLFWNS